MEWIKVFHLLAVFGWMAGVFVAPRGLIYWKREWAATGAMGPAGELTYRVWRFSAGLAVLGVITGIWLATLWGWPGWTVLKLVLVAVLAAHYTWTGVLVFRARTGRFDEGDTYLRIFNELSVLVAIAIFWVVVFKPF